MLFDTHAHMNDRAFDADRAELLTTSLPQAGIALLMNPGCSAACVIQVTNVQEICPHHSYCNT